MDLVRKIAELDGTEVKKWHKINLNKAINNHLTPFWARKIEQVLELEEGILQRWVKTKGKTNQK